MSAQSATGPRDRNDSGPTRPVSTVLQRRLTISSPDGLSIAVMIALLAGVVLRLFRLDAYVLGEREAEWAYDAWSLFHGRPLPAGAETPDTSPAFLLIQSIMFFVFGATDAIARSGAALLGIGLLFLILALRPFVSRQAIVGMMIVAAISPVLVYSSRTNDPAIAVAFFSLLLLVSILRAGIAKPVGHRAGWIGIAGFSVAATLGGGPEGVTALIAVGFGLIVASVAESRSPGAVRAGIRVIGKSLSGLLVFVGSIVAGLLILFSRLFSDLTALVGIVDTFADWGRQMASSATPLPPSFFFYALLLYELLAIVFAIYCVLSRPDFGAEDQHDRRLSPSLFSVWFVTALALHTFASGRETEQGVLIALPLVLLGGLGLGRLIGRIRWSGFWTTRTGLLPMAMVGLLIGVIAIFVAFARANDPQGSGESLLFQVMFIALVVIIPLVYLIWTRTADEQGAVDIGRSFLLVIALALVLVGFRTTTQLAFVRADSGNELIARSVPTEGTRALVDQIGRLSRDLSVENLSTIDNTGSYGVHIAVSPDVEWPFVWYFRDYPNVRVVGPAGWTEDDDIVIAPTPEAMDSAGFVVNQRSFTSRTANAHVDLNAGTILGNIVSPEEWYPSLRYLLFREMESGQPPSTVAVGYAFRVSNQINPSLGPFDIFTTNTPGPGSGLGQLSSPTDIAVSLDGEVIYVINAGNQRIERYARDGTFVGVWDATTDPGLAFAFENGQGPSGMTVGPDGLIYIADTWNHIVLVLDDEGHVVRQLGQRGVQTDIGDGNDPALEPGLFFGPRGVAVLNDEIYVTDTGNERVQVFGKDGTFLRAFGGYGSGTGELLEPTGIVAGPDGNVWVADSGNGRVVVFSPEGEVVREIPVESWADQLGIDRMNDLAFSEDGVLYLSAAARGTLEAWNGESFVEVGTDQLVRPVGITVAPDGALLVVDGAESMVVQLQPELPDDFLPVVATPQASPATSPMATPEG